MILTEQSLTRAFNRMNAAKTRARELRQAAREAQQELEDAAEHLARVSNVMLAKTVASRRRRMTEVERG